MGTKSDTAVLSPPILYPPLPSQGKDHLPLDRLKLGSARVDTLIR